MQLGIPARLFRDRSTQQRSSCRSISYEADDHFHGRGLRNVAEFFGLKYWTEGGQIVHALVTALIGPDGKVVKLYRGNDWQPGDVLADLRTLPRA